MSIEIYCQFFQRVIKEKELRQFGQNLFSIGELVAKLGLQPAWRGEDKGKYECPMCSKQKLSINQDGEKYNCYRCGDTKGIYRELHRQLWDRDGYIGLPVRERRVEPKQQEKVLSRED